MNIQKLKEDFQHIQQSSKEGVDVSQPARDLLDSIPTSPSLSDLQKQKAAIAEKGRLQVAENIKQYDIFREIVEQYEQSVPSPENTKRVLLAFRECVEEQKGLEDETTSIIKETEDVRRKIKFLKELAQRLDALGGA